MRNVLVVDDVMNNYTYLMTVLSKMGCNVLYANNGHDAVEMVKKNSGVDLVFMDLKLPGMSGIEAIKHIKVIKPELPVVAVTAYSTLSIRKEAYEAGCNEYITKPVVLQQVHNILDKYPVPPKVININKKKKKPVFNFRFLQRAMI